MNIVENILLMCSEQGVNLSLNDGALEVLFDDMPSDDLVGMLREHKPAIIEYLSEYKQQNNFTPIKKLGESSGPLSFGQKRLWFIDKLENGSAHYNMPLALELRGNLNKDALHKALNSIVQRHEVLRTSYEVGGARQVVNSTFSLSLNEQDLSGESDSNEQLKALIEQEQLQAFDFASDLMIRSSLIYMGEIRDEQQHVLLVTLHHIACDGWSLGILVNDLVELYTAYATGQESQLAELPVQYSDYAFWQDANREALEQQLGFWTQHLAHAPAMHSLHTDYPRPAYQSFSGDNVSTRLWPEQVAAMHSLCRELDVTPFMFCYSVFALLIGRLSNEADVVIGTPIANRSNSSVEPLIGYFANTLALRSQIDGKQTFAEFVAQNKAMLLEVFNHQDVPFEMVVDRVQPERNLVYSPLFQILFSFHSHAQSQEKLSLPGLQLNDITPKAKAVKTDLELAISEAKDGFVLDWNFSTALFQKSTIERFAACFEKLLASVLTAPGKAVKEYSCMPDSDALNLKHWHGEIASAEADTIHGLFELQVQANPQAVALVAGDVSLTYQALNDSADQVAHYLIQQGVQSEQIVAVKLPRTADLIVALLGVLKAGACYLPLEASYPQARLDYMLENSGAQLVLDAAAMEQIKQASDNNSATTLPAVTREQLAYVIYTSGSTGKPKGVMLSHGNVTRFLQSMSAMLQDKGTWLAVTGISFDISVLEIFGTLANGFKVVLWNDSENESRAPAEIITQEQITHMQCTPSFAMMHLLVNTNAEQLSSLQHLFIGGEAFPPALAQDLQALSNAQLHNMYGPTEATVWASMHNLHKDDVHIPIGKPLTGYQIHILSQDLNEQPIGVPGELFIAGDAVARGYLHNEALTAERFIDVPLGAPDSNTRMYKTGDKARWNDKGQLEFLGRIDSQVKLRGHRIEPDEISAQLQLHSEIENAVVVLDKAAAGDRLAAYLQPNSWPVEQQTLIDNVKRYLGELLPAYMVPTAYVVLQALPLTLNGKVNRNALPPIENDSSVGEYLAPETEIERTLVGVWAELLSMKPEEISCNVSFFDLGGHSLLLTKMLAELKTRFNVDFSIREIFEHATVQALSNMIEERQQDSLNDAEMDKATTVADEQTEEFVL